MKIWRLLGAVVLLTTAVAFPAASNATTILSTFQGRIASDGTGNGGSNGNNMYTGSMSGKLYSSWAYFLIPAGTYTSAVLNITAPTFQGVAIGDVIGLYDVSTLFPVLTGATPGTFAYSDLKSGTSYGQQSFTSLGTTSITLNAAALAKINSGAQFIIGFTNVTENGFVPTNRNNGLLLNGGRPNSITLDLTPAVAVPGPVVGAGLPGLVIALGGLIAWRRRSQASVA